MVAIRIYNGLFGPNLTLAALRMGDLIAVCNFLEYIREKIDNPKLQMYVPDDVVFPSDHCIKMRDWLEEYTDYITTDPNTQLIELQVRPGTDPTYPTMYNLWNIRKDVAVRRQNVFDIEDRVILPGISSKEDIIVMCPLLDAPYNAHRNWGIELTQRLIDSYQYYTQFRKIIICKEPIPDLDIKNFEYSHDLYDNLKFVSKCSLYIGGDTGFSHFAGALAPGPKYCQYLYSKETYGTTYPFNFKSHGRVIHFDDDKYALSDGIKLNELLIQIS
jgi:hypothetical protein